MEETEALTMVELVVSAAVVAVETPMAGWFINCLHVEDIDIFVVRSVHEMFAKNAEFGVETSYDPKLRGYTTELKVSNILV